LFRRLARRGNQSRPSGDFPRLRLLNFIEGRKWIRHESGSIEILDVCAFALVLDENETPIIYVREREPVEDGPWSSSSWVAHEQKSVDIAQRFLLEIIEVKKIGGEFETKLTINVSRASELGFLRFPLNTDGLGVWCYGFVQIDLDSKCNPEEWNDDISNIVFSVGVELDQRIESGWIPSNKENWDWIAYYFQASPLQAGFFGSYKFVLKRLTDILEKGMDSMSEEIYGIACATLGWGYGNIDARASVASKNVTVKDEDNRRIFAANDIHCEFMFMDDKTNSRSYPRNFPLSMEYVSSLPGFRGAPLPSMGTLQYLMRRGYRFANSLNGRAAIAFRAASLMQSILRQSWTQNSVPEKQLLTTRFCYEGSDLVRLDSSAREVILGSKEERDNYLPNDNIANYENLLRIYHENFSTFLSDEDRSLGGRVNPLSAHYFLQCFKQAKLDIPWNNFLALTMADSSNLVLRNESWRYLKDHAEQFMFLSQDCLVQLLNYASIDVLNSLITVAKNEIDTSSNQSYNWLNPALDTWISSRATNPEFREQEFLLATELVFTDPSRALNRMFRSRNEYFNEFSLLLRCLNFKPREKEITRLEEFLNPHSYFSYSFGLEDLPDLFGLKRTELFPLGLLDLNEMLENRLDKLIGEFFTSQVLGHYDAEVRLQVIEEFLKFNKKGAFELVASALPGLDVSTRVKLLDSIFKSDASGEYVLAYTKDTVSKDQEGKLIEIIRVLAQRDFEFFWRRSGERFLKTLYSWVGFKSFLWNKMDELPPLFLEEAIKSHSFAEEFISYPSKKEILRMTPKQVEVFTRIIRTTKQLHLEDRTILGLVKAPSAVLNQVGIEYIKSQKLMEHHWLYLLESNLPVCIQEGSAYLRDKMSDSSYLEMLLSALDSDNETAREIALELVHEIKNVDKLVQVLVCLLENRNIDTWPTVYKNLGLIKDRNRVPEFMNTVFLTLRQARREKEEMKSLVDQLETDIRELISDSTILYMTRSSVAKDREWALKKVALGEFLHKDLKVEHAWSDKNV
jgi:hypothetical protein